MLDTTSGEAGGLLLPPGWRSTGIGALRRGRPRDATGRFFGPQPSKGRTLISAEEAVAALGAILLPAQRRAAESDARILRASIETAAYQEKCTRRAAAAAQDERRYAGTFLREAERYKREQVVLKRRLEAEELALAGIKGLGAGAELLHRLTAAQNGMLAFSRVIRRVWWERSKASIYLVGYAPRFRLGTTGMNGNRYWAGVGPFRVCFSYSRSNGSSCTVTPEPTAHCSGAPGCYSRNYHPHVTTYNGQVLCWGEYSWIAEDARRRSCGFSALAVADKLLASCTRGYTYEKTARWFYHRPRNFDCSCSNCVAWKARYPGKRVAGECQCFGCREERGEELPSPPPDVVWGGK